MVKKEIQKQFFSALEFQIQRIFWNAALGEWRSKCSVCSLWPGQPVWLCLLPHPVCKHFGVYVCGSITIVAPSECALGYPGYDEVLADFCFAWSCSTQQSAIIQQSCLVSTWGKREGSWSGFSNITYNWRGWVILHQITSPLCVLTFASISNNTTIMPDINLGQAKGLDSDCLTLLAGLLERLREPPPNWQYNFFALLCLTLLKHDHQSSPLTSRSWFRLWSSGKLAT